MHLTQFKRVCECLSTTRYKGQHSTVNGQHGTHRKKCSSVLQKSIHTKRTWCLGCASSKPSIHTPTAAWYHDRLTEHAHLHVLNRVSGNTLLPPHTQPTSSVSHSAHIGLTLRSISHHHDQALLPQKPHTTFARLFRY